MHLTHVVILACSTLAQAKPYHYPIQGGTHRSYKTGCASTSLGTASGSAASNYSLTALSYSTEPTSTVAFSSAGEAPTEPSPPSEGGATASSSAVTSALVTSSTPPQSSVEPSSTLAAAPVPSSTATTAPISSGTTYTATFTQYVYSSPIPKPPPRLHKLLTKYPYRYGAGDTFGSPNCNTATAACGWYSNPGYNAAASQNLFGVGPGAGAGPGCGLCFQLTAKTNPYANNVALIGTQSIVVKVNNLCPAVGNELCSQSDLTSTNKLGVYFLQLWLS